MRVRVQVGLCEGTFGLGTSRKSKVYAVVFQSCSAKHDSSFLPSSVYAENSACAGEFDMR